MNQLAMFLRKFGKSSDSQKLLSPELRAKIFPEDAASILAKAGTGGQQSTVYSSSNQTHQVICVNDILGSDDADHRQKAQDDDDELTEDSTDDEDGVADMDDLSLNEHSSLADHPRYSRNSLCFRYYHRGGWL